MENNLLFISVFNYGAIELAKNHIKSLLQNNINNYMAYVTDFESLVELNNLGYNVTKYDIDKTTNDTTTTDKFDFGTNNFNELSYLRYKIIYDLLSSGKDIWYLDTDIVVLENLNVVYQMYNTTMEFDVIFQDDINMVCTGCMLIKNNNKMKQFLELILNNKTIEHNDQIVVNSCLNTLIDIINVTIFNYIYFPNGLLFFRNDFVTTENQNYKNMRNSFYLTNKKIYLVHANWMVGIDKKIIALKEYGLWYL